MSSVEAPGKPGIEPTWTSSAKSGVGTSSGGQSRVWFTISHGIVNEVYYPYIDRANTRDLQFLVTDGEEFFSEEKRDTEHSIEQVEKGVPAYRVRNTCFRGRYRISKTVLTDPHRDVLLQKVRFEPLKGKLEDYHLYVLLASHIENRGYGNEGWVGHYKGVPMLFARRKAVAMALACSAPFKGLSSGYVGFSDGWQDISQHKKMTWFYPRCRDGNVALTGEIDMKAGGGEFILALAFGGNAEEAGQQARSAILQNFDYVEREYVDQWREAQGRCLDLGRKGDEDLYRVSVAVLKVHEAKSVPGGMIASLSVPWGSSKGDDDLGGYHLIWPRDLVEGAEGLLAAGDVAFARKTLYYLMSTQEADGHWPQNMWLDGKPYWQGVQMDEVALPILLADALRRSGSLDWTIAWNMVRKAAGYIGRNGPVTQQDRWEEDGGYSPFTLAVEISALLAAADFADLAGDGKVATYLRETADAWNGRVEHWTYVTGSDFAHRIGVEGHYVKISSPEGPCAASPTQGFVPIKNRPPGSDYLPSEKTVSTDSLALVRFGLRSPNDPRIINTVKVIDAVLKTETATGPVWHRYNGDGYGEHEEGEPFDGTGVGRGWPLLAGERGHYELAAGDVEEATKLLKTMEAQANFGGLIPEQVWDGPDIPAKGLYSGRPSGSAMPLVWAHAEYVKLLRSLKDGRVFDTPPQTVRRYVEDGVSSPRVSWRFNEKCRLLPKGKSLRVEMLEPATVHWSTDDWKTATDVETADPGIGVHYVDLPTEGLPVGSTVVFTFFWPKINGWEGSNFSVEVKDAADETSFGSPSGPVAPPRDPSLQQPIPRRRRREPGPRRHP